MAGSTGPERLRTFVALPIPEPHRELLRAHLGTCRTLAPGFRWVPAENLHLTLRFLGHVEVTRLDQLRLELSQLRSPAFTVALGGRGQFGPRSTPRVVWLAVSDGVSECAALAASIEAICRRLGFDEEARPFRSHVTLARALGRQPVRLPSLPDPPSLTPWTADRLALYESRLGRDGAIYEPIEEFRLER
jgi:2'-5' RNA ligase